MNKWKKKYKKKKIPSTLFLESNVPYKKKKIKKKDKDKLLHSPHFKY